MMKNEHAFSKIPSNIEDLPYRYLMHLDNIIGNLKAVI